MFVSKHLIMHGLKGVNLCYGCVCHSCSRFRCPYRFGRCEKCRQHERKKLYDCDFFEYIKIAPKRLKIVRKVKLQPDIVNQKLNAILEHLGIENIKAESIGVYGVFIDGNDRMFSGSREEVEEYFNKYKDKLGGQLTIKPLRIRF